MVKPPLIPPFAKLSEEVERYRNSVQDYLAERIKGGMPVRICMTSAAWQAVGLPVLPFSMLAVLIDKMAGLASAQKHAVTSAGVSRLPELMASPVAIFRSATRPGAYVGVLDVKDADGLPVIVAVHPAQALGHHKANVVKSVYGKSDPAWFEAETAAGRLLYLDTRKAWFGRNLPGSNSQLRRDTEPSHGFKVLTEAEIVKPAGGVPY